MRLAAAHYKINFNEVFCLRLPIGSRPQLKRGALGSTVIAGGVKRKMLAVWFCGNRSMAKGASEDRLAHLLICWRRTPGSPETAWRQWWMTGCVCVCVCMCVRACVLV